jgi:hypothetical protein
MPSAPIYNISTINNQIRPENTNHGTNRQLVLDASQYNGRTYEFSYLEAINKNPMNSVGFPSALDASTVRQSSAYGQSNLTSAASFMTKSKLSNKSRKNLSNLKCFNTKPKKVLCISASIACLLILLAGVIVTIIYGISELRFI